MGTFIIPRLAEPDEQWRPIFEQASNEILSDWPIQSDRAHQLAFSEASACLDMQRKGMGEGIRADMEEPRHKAYILTAFDEAARDFAEPQFHGWEYGRQIREWSDEHRCPLWVGWKCLMISTFDAAEADFIHRALSAWEGNPALEWVLPQVRRLGCPAAVRRLTDASFDDIDDRLTEGYFAVTDVHCRSAASSLLDGERHESAFLQTMRALDQRLRPVRRRRWAGGPPERARAPIPQAAPSSIYQPRLRGGRGLDLDPQALLGTDYGLAVLRYSAELGCPLFVAWMCLMIARFDQLRADHIYRMFFGASYRNPEDEK
ncbi:MAG: hypothetical protein M1816_003005 [Peltula sp. TS41687]|nr:MAG: hypothetical protein M1816_003005 [Peltula sp. TS41687]